MRTGSLAPVLGALVGTLLAASVSSTTHAHDGPGAHIHLKGRVASSDGQTVRDARVRAIEPGVFPGVPNCQIRSQFEFKMAPDGSYELVLYLEGTDARGRRVPDCPAAFTAPAITVDKTKIRWESSGATVVPR